MSRPDSLVTGGLLTVSEAAATLRLSRSSIYALMDRGALAYVKLGRARRIPQLALELLVEGSLRGVLNGPIPKLFTTKT